METCTSSLETDGTQKDESAEKRIFFWSLDNFSISWSKKGLGEQISFSDLMKSKLRMSFIYKCLMIENLIGNNVPS